MPAFALELEHVVKRYVHHVAVRDLSLRVPVGTVYGLLGPNGAGKTTTLRMILDVIAPDAGTIQVLGRRNTEPGAIDRIGYLPEERGLYRRMQVRRVLRFLGELKGLSRGTADRRITLWLERLGLRTADHDWGNARVDDLSRGMQQKVQFIGALLHEPDVIILDEPFSGLDPINAQALKDIVIEMKRAGRTVLFSTHLMEQAERMCDAVCILARGEKVLDGGVTEVKAAHGGRHVLLELDATNRDGVADVLTDRTLVSRLDDANRTLDVELADGADAQSLLGRLIGAGAVVRRFELAQPSLHRIFIDRVGAAGIEEELTANA